MALQWRNNSVQLWLGDPRYYLLINPDPLYASVVLWDGQERHIIDRREYVGMDERQIHAYLEWAEALYIHRRLPPGPDG